MTYKRNWLEVTNWKIDVVELLALSETISDDLDRPHDGSVAVASF
jgi:hypothetical protein